MDIEKIIEAKTLYDEYDKFQRLKADLALETTSVNGLVEITPRHASTYRFGFSERDTEFLNDLQEAVRRHLKRISDEIKAL